MIAYDVELTWSVNPLRRLLRSARRAALRRHHIALVKNILIFLRKNKYLSALDTRNLDVRHGIAPFSIGQNVDVRQV